MTCATGSCSWFCRTWSFCVLLLYFFNEKEAVQSSSSHSSNQQRDRRSQCCGVFKVHNTQIQNTMECPLILVHYESGNNKWKGLRGFYMSVRLLSTSVSHCFHLDYLDCSLSCWHWGASCIYAILSCSLQTGKALTYSKRDGFATEAKKIMQTCTDSLYLGKNTTHTEDSKLYSFPLLKELFLCAFSKNPP